jgi:EpsI family protein
MMNTTTRLLIVVILVGLLATSSYVVPKCLKPKSVQLPDRNLADLPYQFGSWQGAESEVDPEVNKVLRLDADAVLDRAYEDDQNHVVSLHVALFSDLDAGIRHSPINCYRGNGWREVDRTTLTLNVSDESSIPVSLTTWEREGDRVLVMYWYQLGDHILFNRWDLFWARVDMRGKETWPALVKVLLQTRATDGEKAKERIKVIARTVYQWINEPGRSPGEARSNEQLPVGPDQGPTQVFDKMANSEYNTSSAAAERLFGPPPRQEPGVPPG